MRCCACSLLLISCREHKDNRVNQDRQEARDEPVLMVSMETMAWTVMPAHLVKMVALDYLVLRENVVFRGSQGQQVLQEQL